MPGPSLLSLPHGFPSAQLDRAYEKPYVCLGVIMGPFTVSEARGRLYRLVDEAAASHEGVLITGKRGNAVLVAEEDWRAIQETLFLLSIPGMRESIRKGLKTPVEKCSEKPGW